MLEATRRGRRIELIILQDVRRKLRDEMGNQLIKQHLGRHVRAIDPFVR
jgi:hypothetical protein